MADNGSISGTSCPAKAITAARHPIQKPGSALALLLLIVIMAAPAVSLASPIIGTALTNILGVTALTNLDLSGPFTNPISLTNPPFVPNALSIGGPGYFVLRDPVSGELSATRFGLWTIDSNGFLLMNQGLRVQGYSNPAMTVIGDVRIDGTGWQGTNSSPPAVASFEILTNGCVVVNFADNTSIVRCQILLQTFQQTSTLTPEGWRLYGWSASAGPLPQPVPPGSGGTGWLVPGVLEQLVPQLQLSSFEGWPKSFSQGVLVPTDVPTDIGIEGNGFFVLRRTNDGALFATRAGGFYLDGSGYLVHYSGLRLQGYVDASLTTIGDIRIDTLGLPSTNDPTAVLVSYDFDEHGVITEYSSDGTLFVRGQILLQGCANPDLVGHTNFDLYPINTNNDIWSSLAPPLTNSPGWLVMGSLELSQFDTNLLAARSALNFFIVGSFTATVLPANMAINGPGFFTVRDPLTDTLYATRLGNFELNAGSYLVTPAGLRVQGYTDSTDTTVGDIQVTNASSPGGDTAAVQSYAFNSGGQLEVQLADGTSYPGGQILLQNYRNLQGLTPAGKDLYSNVTAAMPLYTNELTRNFQMSPIITECLEQMAAATALQLPPPGGYRIFINNLEGGTMEASSDLVHWEAIGQVNGSSDLNEAEFFDNPQSTQRFYRVVTGL
jgi:flagellar hook protein FlgE